MTNRTSAAKGSTRYKYDAVGNLTNIVYPVSSNISLAYDAMNRLTRMVDGTGTTVYSYDAAGQLLSEDGPWNDDTVSYTYANRLRTGLSDASEADTASDQASYGRPQATGWLTHQASPAEPRGSHVCTEQRKQHL